MIDISKGRYWDEGIKLISGCTRISPGCKNCWSLGMEHRLGQDIIKKGIEGSFDDGTATGYEIRAENNIVIHPDRLKRFNTRKPKVFAIWNDLFHEAVPKDFINQAIANMMINKQNTYLLLTKRADRLYRYITNHAKLNTEDVASKITGKEERWDWPPANIYLGLTVCNQKEADEKMPIFLQVPGNKFMSIEPCLSEINLKLCDDYDPIGGLRTNGDIINAVILGGETGPGARPMKHDWVRSVRDQCAAAGVDFFFKGWGKWNPAPPAVLYKNRTMLVDGQIMYINAESCRLLDGRTHDELPWVK